SHAFSFNIVYRTDIYGEGKGPQTWAELWDVQKFPGPRTLPVYAPETVTFALLADGVTQKTLYPLDLDRAFASLDRIKKHVRVFWQSGAQSRQLIQDKEVHCGSLWASASGGLIQEGVPLTLVRNQAVLEEAFWAVSKGTPRAKNAWKFIQFAT